jgi:putative glutamine amidotransferase
MRPIIAVTLTDPAGATDPEAATAKTAKYIAALERAGASPMGLTERSSAHERRSALRAMSGLLISGGADLAPARYGQEPEPRTVVNEARDSLDAHAWAAAAERNVPVLGICRGMQAINVFSGGGLVQHLDGHVAAEGPVVRHAIEVEPESRLGRIVGPRIEVNSYHHQAVLPEGLGSGLRPTAFLLHDGLVVVEALESRDPSRWLVGVQCHPERTETSPPELAALFDAFVAACQGDA